MRFPRVAGAVVGLLAFLAFDDVDIRLELCDEGCRHGEGGEPGGGGGIREEEEEGVRGGDNLALGVVPRR